MQSTATDLDGGFNHAVDCAIMSEASCDSVQEGEHAGYQSRGGTEGDERSRTCLGDEQQHDSSTCQPASTDAASPPVQGNACGSPVQEAAPAQQPTRLPSSSALHDPGRVPQDAQASGSRSLLGQPGRAAYHASACAADPQISAPAPMIGQGVQAPLVAQSLAHSMQRAEQDVGINGKRCISEQVCHEEAEDTESDDDIQVRPMNREALLRSLMGSAVAEDAIENFVASLKY